MENNLQTVLINVLNVILLVVHAQTLPITAQVALEIITTLLANAC